MLHTLLTSYPAIRPEERRLREEGIKRTELLIGDLFEKKRDSEALLAHRKMIDLYHLSGPWLVPLLALSELEVDIFQADVSGSLAAECGDVFRLGTLKITQNDEMAYRCYCDAADKGHVYALTLKGWMLSEGIGTPECRASAFECLTRAAHGGSQEAAYALAHAMMYGFFKEGGEIDWATAAIYFRLAGNFHDAEAKLAEILRKYPSTVVPWGTWFPNVDLQCLVFDEIHEQQKTWMLVAQRVGLLRNVALIVAGYVCTRT